MSRYYEFWTEAFADIHVHLRQNTVDVNVVGPLVEDAVFGGADVVGTMPNTEEGLKTAQQVIDYNNQAKTFVPSGKKLTILPMVLFNEETTEEIIDECMANGIVDCKVYPFDRTTKSHNGVRWYNRMLPILKYAGKVGMNRHFHPEYPLMTIGNREAEHSFLSVLDMLLDETEGVIIAEHGSDGRCIASWEKFAQSGRFYLTLTPHHLCAYEDLVYGYPPGIVKPPIKTREDMNLLCWLVEQNYPWVMAGSDRAPHDISGKYARCKNCQCGAYFGRYVVPLYAHALDRLVSTPFGVETFNNFMSRNARKLHNLPLASFKVKLTRQSCIIPSTSMIGPWTVDNFFGGREILYMVAI